MGGSVALRGKHPLARWKARLCSSPVAPWGPLTANRLPQAQGCVCAESFLAAPGQHQSQHSFKVSEFQVLWGPNEVSKEQPVGLPNKFFKSLSCWHWHNVPCSPPLSGEGPSGWNSPLQQCPGCLCSSQSYGRNMTYTSPPLDTSACVPEPLMLGRHPSRTRFPVPWRQEAAGSCPLTGVQETERHGP